MPAAGRSFLQRFLPGSNRAAPALAPAGTALYVIGDIHGRSDLLHSLLRKIAIDAARCEPNLRRELIFLGDYVDRGPDSKGVIDLLLATQAEQAFWSVTPLKGNHEQALLQFMEEPEFWPMWQDFGARETLLSYGVNPPARGSEPDDWLRASREINTAMPYSHRRFLESLDLLAERGDYLCVHAGVRPGAPLDQQTEQDLLWIRDDFLRNERRLDKVIVHGHTPTEEAYVGPHRIGLDTGAYATSVLTAIKLKGADQTLIQARPADALLADEI
jgi:serine/threonine protein phosphatase 1